MVVEWVCEYCGLQGVTRLSWPDTVEVLQCRDCGEPVTPIAEHAD